MIGRMLTATTAVTVITATAVSIGSLAASTLTLVALSGDTTEVPCEAFVVIMAGSCGPIVLSVAAFIRSSFILIRFWHRPRRMYESFLKLFGVRGSAHT